MTPDRQEIKKKLLPKDLISEDQVIKAFENWRHTEHSIGWSDDMINTAQRLVLEVFLPSMNAEGHTKKLWREPQNQENTLYYKILGNFQGRTINRLSVVAWAITNKLVKEAKKIKKTKINNEYVIPGDIEVTNTERGVAGVGGRSPFIFEDEANPKGLGYVQSQRED